MSEERTRISNILTPISFVLSLVAMILVILESSNFTKKNIQEETQDKNNLVSNKSQDNIKNESITEDDINSVIENSDTSIQKTTVTLSEKNETREDMKDLIKDLEMVYSGGKKSNTVDIKPKTANEKPSKSDFYQILLKSFEDKDDAILELNRLRLQHKDLTSKIETSVKPFKKNDEKLFGIFGKIKGDIKLAESYCEKFESRGTPCVIV